MTDLEIDADIAQILHRHHTRKRLGYTWYDTNPHPTGPGHATHPPHNKGRAGKPRRTRQPAHGDTHSIIAELDTLQHTVAFALAGLTIRQGAA